MVFLVLGKFTVDLVGLSCVRSAAACSASDLTSERTQFISFIKTSHGAVLSSIYVGLCWKCLSFCAHLQNWDVSISLCENMKYEISRNIIRRYALNSIDAEGRTDITS